MLFLFLPLLWQIVCDSTEFCSVVNTYIVANNILKNTSYKKIMFFKTYIKTTYFEK